MGLWGEWGRPAKRSRVGFLQLVCRSVQKLKLGFFSGLRKGMIEVVD